MILIVDIKPFGELSPVMVAKTVGESIRLPYEIISTINNDEQVQLQIEIKPEMVLDDYFVEEPFNTGEYEK